MSARNINITITGSNNKGKELVSNVVTNALVAEGFSNVALVTPHGEPMVGSDVPSLMDVMKAHDPEFLATKINVIGIPETAGGDPEDATTTAMNNGIHAAVGVINDEIEGVTLTTTIITEVNQPA